MDQQSVPSEEFRQINYYLTSLKKLLTDGLPLMKKGRYLSPACADPNHKPATAAVNFAKIFPHGLGIQDIFQDGASITLTWRARQDNSYSSDADVRFNVRNVLSDMIGAGGFSGKIKVNNELTVTELRPDILVIKTPENSPVGVVVIKRPTDGILNADTVLGQLFDHMLKLHCFNGRDRVIGILTTYEEWRVCELDFDKINERTMFATEIYRHDNLETLPMLISTLSAMLSTNATQLSLKTISRPFLFVTEEEIFQWQYLPSPMPTLSCQIPQLNDFTGLYMIRDYQSGADGRAWLGCSTTGNLAVVKFLQNENGYPNNYLQRVESEVNCWNLLFGQNTAFQKTLFGVAAIVMPFVFHCRHNSNNNMWDFTNSLSQWNSISESIADETRFREDVTKLIDEFQDIRTTAEKAIELLVEKNLIHEDIELRHLGLLPVFEQQILKSLVPVFIDLSRVVSHQSSSECRQEMLSRLNSSFDEHGKEKS